VCGARVRKLFIGGLLLDAGLRRPSSLAQVLILPPKLKPLIEERFGISEGIGTEMEHELKGLYSAS
jgi:hypothetical protein